MRIRGMAVQCELAEMGSWKRKVKSLESQRQLVLDGRGPSGVSYESVERMLTDAERKLKASERAYQNALANADLALNRYFVSAVHTPVFPHMLSLIENTLDKPLARIGSSESVPHYLNALGRSVRGAEGSSLVLHALKNLAKGDYSPLFIPAYLERVARLQSLPLEDSERLFLAGLGGQMLPHVQGSLSATNLFAREYDWVIDLFGEIPSAMRERVMNTCGRFVESHDERGLVKNTESKGRICDYFRIIESGFRVDPVKTM